MTTTPRIIAETAQHYGIPSSAILGHDRQRRYARPRQVAMYLARVLTGRSYPEIAMSFGRDHSTVHHAVDVICHLQARDASVAGAIMAITERCAPEARTHAPVRLIAQIIAGASWRGFSKSDRQGFRALAGVAA